MAENEFCVKTKDITTYIFILGCIILFVMYFYIKQAENMSNIDLTKAMTTNELRQKIIDLQSDLYNTKLSEQKCKNDLSQSREIQIQSQPQQVQTAQSRLLNKIYNPLVSPERIYPGGRLGTSSYDNYQMMGFVFQGDQRYPLYGRYKYPGKTDKYEYYLIDETRNRLKIPFKSPNYNELFDGDNINVPELGGGFEVKLYEYENFRYDPTVL